jgi:hypothetical protein
MRAEQLSIFLENKAGSIAEVTAILRDAGVNIRALSLADTTDFGVLRMIVNNTKKAEEALKKEGFSVGKTNIVAISVDDSPGGLNKILDPIYAQDINVEYMYAFANPKQYKAIVVFRFDDADKAITILKENSIEIIDGEKVYNL